MEYALKYLCTPRSEEELEFLAYRGQTAYDVVVMLDA